MPPRRGIIWQPKGADNLRGDSLVVAFVLGFARQCVLPQNAHAGLLISGRAIVIPVRVAIDAVHLGLESLCLQGITCRAHDFQREACVISADPDADRRLARCTLDQWKRRLIQRAGMTEKPAHRAKSRSPVARMISSCGTTSSSIVSNAATASATWRGCRKVSTGMTCPGRACCQKAVSTPSRHC